MIGKSADWSDAFAAPLVLQLQGNEISARRLALLEGVAQSGSISGAARLVGMTYKAAWDAIDAMNNLAGEPLVRAQHGGSHGGGAALTVSGEAVLATQKRLASALAAVLDQFTAEDGRHIHTLRRLLMKTSARNVLRGNVREVTHGAVNSEVTLALQGGDALVAIVTRESAEHMALAPGKPAWALVKSSWVILAPEDECGRSSARNRLCGTVSRVTPGAVNAEVVLQLAGGNTLTAIITEVSLDSLGFAVGSRVCALIKASHVILGVDE